MTAPSLGTKLYTISPCRVLDTRFTPPAVTTVPRVVQMSGSCGIPLEASGVVGNLAAIPLGSGGLFRLYPTGTTPATSTLNFNAGQVRANNFQLGLSGNGQLSLSSNTTAEAVVDAVGYFAHDLPTWTVTLRDEANRLVTEYTVPPSGQGSISRVRSHLYLGNLLVATRNTSGGYTYFASDHLGTPRVGTGANPETHKYQPFGTEIPGASGGLPIKFAAMEPDLSSGNDFDHARYQSSLLGRFLSPDKLQGDPQDPQSWNRYAYALNNPLKLVDPDGRAALRFEDYVFIAKETVVNTVDQLAFLTAQPLLRVGAGILNNDPREFALGAGELLLAGAAGGITQSLAGPAAAELTRVRLPNPYAPRVQNPALQATIDRLYKASAKYPGGTAGIIRAEGSHLQAGINRIGELRNIIKKQKLDPADIAVAKQEIRRLLEALRYRLNLNLARLQRVSAEQP